jgi:O-antigen ligase
VQEPSLATPTSVDAELFVERNISVNVADTVMKVVSGQATVRQAMTGQRHKFWFEQPNLAGHTIVAVGLALVSTCRTALPGLVGLLLTLTGVFSTGSRAAFLAALVGLPWLLSIVISPRQRKWLLLLVLPGAVAFMFLFGIESLGRLKFLGVDELTTRPEIWTIAWQAFVEHPWTGIGPEKFGDYWQANYRGESNELVAHAHNLWLHFAAGFGLPGLLAALWLTGSLTYFAAYWAGWRGLALVVPVLLMNTFDYTLFYSGVLFPLILGLNSLGSIKEGQVKESRPTVASDSGS